MGTPTYRLAQRAVADLEAIAEYLGARNPSAADRVVDELFRTFDAIAISPNMGTNLDELRPGLRVYVPERPATNYLVFYYRVSDGVMVSGVIHAARDWIGMISGGER